MAITRKKPYLPYPDGTGGDSPYLTGDLGLAVPDAPTEGQSPYMQQALAAAGGDIGKYGIGAGTFKNLSSGVGDGGTGSPAFEERPELGSATGETSAPSAPPASTKPYVEDLSGASAESDRGWQKGSGSFSTTPQNKPYVEGPPLAKTDVPRHGSGGRSFDDDLRQKDEEIAKARKGLNGWWGVAKAGLLPTLYHGEQNQLSQLRQERSELVRQARYDEQVRGHEAARQQTVARDEERYRHQKATEERAANPPTVDREGREMRWNTETRRYAPALESRTREMPVQGPMPDVGGVAQPPASGTSPLTADEPVMRGIPGEKPEKPEKPTIIKGPGGAVYERRGDEQPKLLIPGKPDKPEKTKEPKPEKPVSLVEINAIDKRTQAKMDKASTDQKPMSWEEAEAQVLAEGGYKKGAKGRFERISSADELGPDERQDTKGRVWKLKADRSGWELKTK